MHKDVLKALFPVDLAGVSDADFAIEGAHLDATRQRALQLLNEAFADSAWDLLPGWERVCVFIPSADDTVQYRRDRVVAQLRKVGGLSRAYFTALATTMGYVITIEEMLPFMCGWNGCGDVLYVEGVRFVWRVTVTAQRTIFKAGLGRAGNRIGSTTFPVYYFRAGDSASGERLTWWSRAVIETIFNELKPAHTFIIFIYG